MQNYFPLVYFVLWSTLWSLILPGFALCCFCFMYFYLWGQLTVFIDFSHKLVRVSYSDPNQRPVCRVWTTELLKIMLDSGSSDYYMLYILYILVLYDAQHNNNNNTETARHHNLWKSKHKLGNQNTFEM